MTASIQRECRDGSSMHCLLSLRRASLWSNVTFLTIRHRIASRRIGTSTARADETWAVEFVMYDAGGRWALFADADATVLGAEGALADQIDKLLASQGTSLESMTYEGWGELDPLTQPGARYILSVCSQSE